MREQLIQYVELLFAGGRDCEDIKQEILQNTLDRYDDLIAEGKVPEAAYRLAITGIGDINEILGTKPQTPPVYHAPAQQQPEESSDTPTKKLLRAIAIGLYILCPLPLIVLSEMGMDTLGFCGLLSIVAVATVLIILGARKNSGNSIANPHEDSDEPSPKSELSNSISGLLWAVGTALYFIISFTTNAWHITWVIFPIVGALDGLLKTIVRNKEATNSGVMFPSRWKFYKGIRNVIWAIGLAVYFILSFATMAWYITWLVFPITGAVQGLVMAILDLKEAMKNET